MPDHSLTVWILLILICGGATLGFLHLIASLVRNEIYVHDLKVKVAELQWMVVEKTKAQRENAMFADLDVEPVPEQAPRPARKAA